jgi:YegS/Rv2252/BmrU family lipid kinase
VKALFVVNRRSGAKRLDDVETIIRKACGWEHEFAECDRDALDATVSRAERNGFNVVFAVGGDGTVHEVAKRLIGRSLALGIVPTGSGNGLARHLGLPIHVTRSLAACSGGRFDTIDTASVNGTPFISTMGVGFDAWIADAFASRDARGLRTYLRVGLTGLWSYAPQEYELIIDGEKMRRSALLIAVANASQYGNNARIAPVASLQDGVLDVVIVERRSLRAAARLFAGSLHRAPGITMLRARQIEIRRPAGGPAHLDGEPVTLPESLTIKIVPRSLRVLLPDSARPI